MKSNHNCRRNFVNRDDPDSGSEEEDEIPIEVFNIAIDQGNYDMQNIVIMGGDGENIVVGDNDDDDEDEDDSNDGQGGDLNFEDNAGSQSAPEFDVADEQEGAAASVPSAPSRIALKRKASSSGPGDDGSDSSTDSFDSQASDSDDMDDDDTDLESASSNVEGIDDEDDVVKAIIANTKTVRSHPPDIETEEFVVDLSFHPQEDILAVGTLGGDILVYKYTNEENTLLTTLEMHTKAIRDIEFNDDGSTLFSASKDKSIVLSDVHTGKLKRFYDEAHTAPVYRMNVIDENLFASGE